MKKDFLTSFISLLTMSSKGNNVRKPSKGFKVTYYVNREKGTVVCKFTECEEYFNSKIQKYLKHPLSLNFYFPDSFIGIAKCSPLDVFNESVGKRIAFSKATISLERKLSSFARKTRKSLSEYCTEIDTALTEIIECSDERISRKKAFIEVFNDENH